MHRHHPGAARRDPARLALTSGRSTFVAANAPGRALRQGQHDRTDHQPWPVPDPRFAWRKISLLRSSTAPTTNQLRNHLDDAKLEIPIDRHRNPAASCMGGFRTPALCLAARPELAGIRKPSPSRSSQPNQAIPEADAQGDHVRVASRPRSIITAPESSHCQRIGKREPWINSVSKVRCPFTGGRQFYCCHKNASGSTRGRSRGCAQPSRCV